MRVTVHGISRGGGLTRNLSDDGYREKRPDNKGAGLEDTLSLELFIIGNELELRRYDCDCGKQRRRAAAAALHVMPPGPGIQFAGSIEKL